MGKTKHNPPGKKSSEPSFIKFAKSQTNYLREVRARQQQEFNNALEIIYEEQGILEKILQAPPGKYIIRKDFSGLDVLPVAQPDKKITVPEKPGGAEKEAEQSAEKPEEKSH